MNRALPGMSPPQLETHAENRRNSSHYAFNYERIPHFGLGYGMSALRNPFADSV